MKQKQNEVGPEKQRDGELETAIEPKMEGPGAMTTLERKRQVNRERSVGSVNMAPRKE